MLGIFLDIESNGLNYFKHRVLEIAFRCIDLLTGEEKASFNAIVRQNSDIWEKSDLTSLKINGFTYDLIANGKPEEEVKEEIVKVLTHLQIDRKNAVFLCQNPSFDRIFFSQIIDPDLQELLHWPYHWLDLASMYWATSLKKAKEENSAFPWETGYSKDQIAQNLSLAVEQKPHRAMNGVDHLIYCYKELVGFPYY